MDEETKQQLEADFLRAKTKFHTLDKYGSLVKPYQLEYAQTFQRLVKAGLRMQIKKKYRGR